MSDFEFPTYTPKLDGTKVAYAVKRFRDAHHRVARLIAMGVRPMERVAEITGYSLSRIYSLNTDPSFKELVTHYSLDGYRAYKENTDPVVEDMVSVKRKALRQIEEQLDEADETGEALPIRTLASLVADMADRTGYGKKQTNVNINVDFAAQLEKAIARSSTVIDLKPIDRVASSGASQNVPPVEALPQSSSPRTETFSPSPPSEETNERLRRRA